MSEIERRFSFEGHGLRVVMTDGEPWFVAADLCTVLELTDVRRAVERLDQDDRRQTPVVDSAGRLNPNTYVISESGVYDLIMRSDKPVARPLRRFVTHEVLPQILRTGSYGQVEALPGPKTYKEALQALLALEDRREEEERRRQIAEGRVGDLEEKVTEAAPKVEGYDAFLSADGDHSVAVAAGILSRERGVNIGQNQLFKKMAEWGMVFRRGGEWRAYRKHCPGRLAEKEHLRTNSDGDRVVGHTVRITSRGLDYIRRKLAEERPRPANGMQELA